MDFKTLDGRTSRHLLLAYVWSVNNIGDIAIAPGLVSLLRQHCPDLPVRLIASQTEQDPAYAYVQDYFGRNYPQCETLANPFKPLLGGPRFGDLNSAWGRFCARWGPAKMESFAKGCIATELADAMAADVLNVLARELVAELAEKNPAALAAFRDAGFLVYASGTTLNFGRLQARDFWTFTLHFAMPLIIAQHLRLPYGINGQSFDAIDWPGDLVMRPVFRDAQFVFSRDSDSENYLKQRNLGNRVGGFRPDSTFFFNVHDEPWAEQYLRAHGLEDRKFLVLITRHSAPLADTTTAWDTVGGDPTAGSVSRERQERQMKKLRTFLDNWVARTNLPVLLALETRAAQEPMRQWLDRDLLPETRKKLVWLADFWTTEQAYSIYKRARIVISMEMHSIIMALQSRTPTIHIPFREAGRKAKMLDDLAVPDWLLDIDEMTSDDLLAVCLKIDGDFANQVQRTHDAMTVVDRLGRDVLQHLASGWKKTL